LVDAGTTEVNNSLAARAAIFASIVEERTSDITASLGAQADRFAAMVDDKSSELTGTIDQQSKTLSELIETRTTELDSSLKSHGNILRAALELSANEAEDLMSTSTGRITTEVTGALEKLNDSNTLLQQVLDTATTNLAELESSVGRHTSTYAQTVMEAVSDTHEAGRMMNDHVSELRSTITQLAEELQTIKTTLADQTAGFSGAARELSDAGLVTVSTLEEGRTAMEALVSGFTVRADDIDAKLKTFSVNLTDTVSQTEDRIAISQRAMEETVRASAETLTDNLKNVAEAASGESEKVTARLRETQVSLASELQAAIRDANDHFADSAQSMRETAAEIGKELEAARNEIKRSVIELPEETRASAAAMRRVVAEQIEALNELNSIVRSQPASHDLSNSRAHSGNVVRPATPATPTAGTPTAGSTPAASNAKPAAAPPAKTARAAVGPGPQRKSIGDSLAAKPAPAGSTTAAKSESDGWLRDLLRNASANQLASAADASSGISLTGMSLEINRAFDVPVLTEAWKRYRMGEQGAFSRRIYTLSGQGTYDDVRKRIRREPEFADAANTFMVEFEVTLNEVTGGADGINRSLELLVSDQGRVYTMLSHASSRLD